MAGPTHARKSRRSVHAFRPQLQRLEDRLAMTVGASATWVDDSWTFVGDVDGNFALSIGDVVINDHVAGQYGISAFGHVTAGLAQGSLPGATTINDAINATSDGGIVFLEAGTYNESVTITKSLWLEGDSPTGLASDVVIKPPSTDSAITVAGAAVNATIRDVRLTGSHRLPALWATSAASLTLTNVRADGNSVGIIVSNVSGAVSFSGVVADNNETGAGIFNSGPVTISDSSFSNNTDSINGGMSGLAVGNMDAPVRLTDVTASGNAGNGILLVDLGGDATLVRVTADNNDADNDGFGSGLSVIRQQTAVAIAGDLLIQGSRFRDTGGANDHQERGIYIESITGSATFEDSPGPSPQSMEVTGNESDGVTIADGGTTATFTKGHYSSNGGDGLAVVSSGDVSLYRVAASDNIKGGILFDHVGDVVLDGTTALSNGVAGVSVYQAGAVTITDSDENGSAYSVNGAQGITVVSVASVRIDYTESNDNGREGIYLSNIGGAVTVTDLTAKNNGDFELSVSNAPSVNIVGTTFFAPDGSDPVRLEDVASLGWGARNSDDEDLDIFVDSSTSLNAPLPIVINGATAATQYTELDIRGDIDLNDVPLVLSGDYIPAPGDSFTILTAWYKTGTFQNLPEGSVLNFNGQPLQIHYGHSTVTLTALPPGFYAVNDQFTVVAGTPQKLNLLANDFIDNNSGAVAEVYATSQGVTWTTNADGTINYRSTTPGDYRVLYDANFQQHKLLASDGATGDALGNDVAIDGNTLIVGARLDDGTKGVDQGAAYIYVRSGTGWVQQAKLVPSDAAKGDFFGASVSISGNTVIVGAPGDDLTGGHDQGSAYVFVRTGTTWKQQAKLTATNIGASDAATGDAFGTSVAIVGNMAVVGAPLDDGSAGADQGSAYFFQRNGVTWGTSQKLTPTDPVAGDRFGWDVDIDAATIVVGAQGANEGQGSAYVFGLGFVWGQVAKLTASDGAVGDRFGISVAISGNTIVVGADHHDPLDTTNQGAAYVYERSGLTWTERELPIFAAAGDFYGSSVAIDGNLIAVGASGVDGFSGKADQGSVMTFRRGGQEWYADNIHTASDGAAGDSFGVVAVSGNTLAVGAPGADVAKGANRGAVYVRDVRHMEAEASVKVVVHQFAASTLAAVPGLPVTFISTFAPGVTGTVTFKEGTKVLGTAPVAANGKASLTLAFETYGNHTLSATFGAGVPVTTAVNVVQAAYLPDPLFPNQSSLFVGGTTGADTILVESLGVEYLRVTVKSPKIGSIPAATYTGVFSNGVERIVVYGGKGNDNITIQPALTTPAWVYGQDGNDTITGGGGNDLLFGGAGDDKLGGALGRDILFGGAGKDSLNAGSGGSILLPGPSPYETKYERALLYAQSEWASDHDLATRVSNLGEVLYSTGTSATVQTDTSADTLNGSAAADWFFANRTGSGTKDKIVGLTATDIAYEL